MGTKHFDFQEIWLDEIASTLREDIAYCRLGYEYHKYSPEFLAEMVDTYNKLIEVAVKIRRIERVFGFGESEEDYFEQLQEDLKKAAFDNPSEDLMLVGEEVKSEDIELKHKYSWSERENRPILREKYIGEFPKN